MSAACCPFRIQSVHVESIDDELCVYDILRQRVHSLNHTAAFVWLRCDGRTTPAELAAALSAEASIDDAEAVVQLTLHELAAAELLVAPLSDVARVSRRDVLRRGVSAAAIPAIYSIVAPSPAAAQSPPPAAAPTLTGVSPNLGTAGTPVAVTLTGTNFVVGATTVAVSGAGVTVNTVVVGSPTSLTANFVLDPTAAPGARTVTVTTAAGTSATQPFTINAPAPGAPTLISVAPNLGLQGTTVAVTLTGTNFVVGGTTVNVSGTGVTVNTVVVGSPTSLTANFVLQPTATPGDRAVTVMTSGTSGSQNFKITLPPPTLTNVAPNQGTRATTVAVTLTGTNFVVGATKVVVSGSNVTVNTVVVNSSTSLTANFMILASAPIGARTVTVETEFGTSGPQPFTINGGSAAFAFTGGSQTFTVPAGVETMAVTARGAQGGGGASSAGGQGGVVTALFSVVPGEILNVFVGGQGGTGDPGVGGFNGGGTGGPSLPGGGGGGGGGATDIRSGGSGLSNRVVVAGGGGGGGSTVSGGVGGGATGGPGSNSPSGNVVTGGGGGTQSVGGLGGASPNVPNNGQDGTSGTGGAGGFGAVAGGGGGGGYYGGGGGAGNNVGSGSGGGGGSSFVGAGVTLINQQQGTQSGDGSVLFGW